MRTQKKAREIRSLYLSGVIDHLVIFYASHEPEKHPPVLEHDYLFDSELTMAENIAIATKKLLNLPEITKDNGLFPIKGNTHRKYSKRIVIHPTSTEKERIWDQAKFFKVAKTLQKKGYEVAFCLTEKEQLGFVEAKSAWNPNAKTFIS